MRRLFVAMALVCLVVSGAGNALAQTANGSVGGVVQDASDALIPGVTVTLTNTETGVTSTQLSNESGSYNFASVQPGSYKVTAEMPGFKTSVIPSAAVGTAAQVRLNLKLEVGAVSARVEVSVTASQLLTESSASVGDVLPEYRIRELPLVGNNILDLVKILPGYRQSQFSTPGTANYDTFAGQDLNSVNVTRDGLSITDGRYAPTTYGLSTTTNINPELVGEIRLILAPVDAELGRGNSQIQIQTRSGTNRFSGSAVWNVQNTGLNANTWANNNDIVGGVWTPTRPNWRNTHDVTVTYGGPVVKNKTFFFASWDQQKSRTRTLQTNTVYTDSARLGVFRYWEGWNPGQSQAQTTYGITQGIPTGTTASVDSFGNPVRPPTAPAANTASATQPYTGNLRCLSVFGNVKADGSSFGDADCPGGIAVVNATPWDTFRQTSALSHPYYQKLMAAMPRANYFGAGDGLNTAAFRWVRGTAGSGGGNAAVGVDSNVNRRQFNIKMDQNFSSNHRLSGSWSYQLDDSADFVPAWPAANDSSGNLIAGLNGQTRRRPSVLTVTGTSTLSSTMVNEARFGLRYQVTGQFVARESIDKDVQQAAIDWYLPGGANPTNGVIYPVGFNPAGVGNGAINFGQSLGNTTPLYNFADTFSWTHGRHSLRFGADVRLTRSNGYNSIGGNTYPTVTGGASTGLGSALASTNNFGTELPGFNAGARGGASNLLYFMNASVSSASMLYWADSAADFTNGTWQDMSTIGKKYRNQVSNEWAVFWKDDWKVTRDLTLNLGVRYDYYGSPYIGSGFTSSAKDTGRGLFGVSRVIDGDQFDKWLRPGNTFLSGYGSNAAIGNNTASSLQCTNGTASQAPGIPVANCDPNLLTTIEFIGPNTPNPDKVVIPRDNNNFSPAVGFAWQLPWGGRGKTTVRGGYQITYGGAGRDGIGLDTLLGSAPGNTTAPATNLSDTVFANILATRALTINDLPILVPVRPSVLPGQAVPVSGHSGTFEAYDPERKTSYTQNITLQVTRSVSRNMTLDVRYVGTFGRQMGGTVNLNEVTVFDNPELFQALQDTRAGKDSPLFDQMLAGLDFHGATNQACPGGIGGNAVYGPIGTTVTSCGQSVLQTGSGHLRRNATYTANLANGNFEAVVSSLATANAISGSVGTTGVLQPLPTGKTGVGARVLRNGCDRLANQAAGLALVAPTAPTRCFPENYFQANPQFGTVNYNTNLGHNNYHSLQVQYTLRPTQGISFQSTYSFAKTLGDNYTTFVDVRNRRADYSLNYASIPHEFRMNGSFELPVGPNKLLLGNSSGVVARVLEKWQTSVIYNVSAGAPRDTFSNQMLYAGGGGNQPQSRPDIVGPWVNPHTDWKWNGLNNAAASIYGYPSPYFSIDDPQCSSVAGPDSMGFNLQANCTLNALALIVPAGTEGAFSTNDGTGRFAVPVLQNSKPGTQGTQGPRMLRLPGRWSLDANVSKTFKLSESKTLQVRIDTNNVLNHPNPGEPTYNIQSADFGRATAKATNARTFQGQIRIGF